MTEPIKPSEVADLKNKTIPSVVFEVVNSLIANNYSGGYARVYQKDIVKILVDNYNFLQKDIFDNGWLNVEESYRQAGWFVKYDKPGFNEGYPATFEFRKNQ